MNTLHDDISNSIEQMGRAIISIAKNGKQPAFAFTIGNHQKNLPELFLLGINKDDLVHLLNDLSDKMIEDGRAFANGEVVSMCEHKVQIWQAGGQIRDHYTQQCTEFFGHTDYGVFQVMLPDQKGKFAVPESRPH